MILPSISDSPTTIKQIRLVVALNSTRLWTQDWMYCTKSHEISIIVVICFYSYREKVEFINKAIEMAYIANIHFYSLLLYHKFHLGMGHHHSVSFVSVQCHPL